jgi:hypothetical protein
VTRFDLAARFLPASRARVAAGGVEVEVGRCDLAPLEEAEPDELPGPRWADRADGVIRLSSRPTADLSNSSRPSSCSTGRLGSLIRSPELGSRESAALARGMSTRSCPRRLALFSCATIARGAKSGAAKFLSDLRRIATSSSTPNPGVTAVGRRRNSPSLLDSELTRVSRLRTRSSPRAPDELAEDDEARSRRAVAESSKRAWQVRHTRSFQSRRALHFEQIFKGRRLNRDSRSDSSALKNESGQQRLRVGLAASQEATELPECSGIESNPSPIHSASEAHRAKRVAREPYLKGRQVPRPCWRFRRF